MKRAVSISLGSSKRDKVVEIELLGEGIRIERIGTDGDMAKATQMFTDLDGKVDAFGVGGTDLGLQVGDKWYRLHSVHKLVQGVTRTPVVDGGGVKETLESRLASFVEMRIGEYVRPKRALITSGADRWGMTKSFLDARYDCVIGDLMFALGLPVPLRTERSVKFLAAVLLPIVFRLPFEWIYPTGQKQERRTPKWGEYFQWATLVAGDCHYIRPFMPPRLEGKVIVTNTTTPDDVSFFRQAGVKYLITTTPVMEGRSFGANMLEAALVAVAGKGRPLSREELEDLLGKVGIGPQLQELN